jgi:D-beta-D-heptose 7-phosphate kinase / D-beta-D-heptose 1-phosphate adenosyltransferase
MIELLTKKRPNILVVGDLMLDSYMWGGADRISPEAPVPVVAVTKESKSLGGAGNVVANLTSLGANVWVSSILGLDDAAKIIKSEFERLGADVGGIFEDETRTTSLKTRVMAGSHQIVRFDKESKDEIKSGNEEKIFSFAAKNIKNFDAILLSDYKKGVITDILAQKLITLSNENNIPVLADPKGTDYSKYKNATLLTPNKKEAKEATKIDIKDDESLKAAGLKLKRELNLKYSVITLSEDGIGIFDENETIKLPTLAQEVFDVTGAGDTVLSALGIALALGADIVEAAKFANKAAAVVVAKVGSATVTLQEIISFENKDGAEEFEDKIVNRGYLKKAVESLKQNGKKVVFTNGCFDILHSGHVKYLSEARKLGDALVIGLNTDASVRALKGEGRPINNEADRASVLAALGFVDFITLFGEETPKELIDELIPDILVKGADYKPEEIVGYDTVTKNGGKVMTIELVEGRSTTKTIERIKANS